MSLVVVRPGREEPWVEMQVEELGMVESLDDDEMPGHYTFHPHPGGLLLWGNSNQGDMFSGARAVLTRTSGPRSCSPGTATGGSTRAVPYRWPSA